MVSFKQAGSLTAALAVVSHLAINAANADGPVPVETDQSKALTVTKSEIDVALASNCKIYETVLKKFDEEHINGRTTTSHSDMATIAVKSAAGAAILLSESPDKPVFELDREDAAFSMTFTDGVILAPAVAPDSLQTYSEHCNFFAVPFKTIHEKTGVEIKDLYVRAINAVIDETRDPHSSYIPPAAAGDFREKTRGSFVGIGANISKDQNGFIKVEDFVEGGAAEKSELQKGDFITHINGKTTKDMSSQDAAGNIRGELGTDVVLTIKRGEQEAFDITITRANVEPKVVTHKMIGDTLHVTVTTFNEQTYKQFFEAIAEGMSEWSGKTATNLEKLVIDVRGNPGGLLEQVAYMIDRLIHQDEPGLQKQIMATGKSADDLERIYINDTIMPANFPKFRISVLTDGGSASASEILAGALVDEGHDVVGTRSYGKGSVQTIYPIMRGQGGLARITTAAFFPGTSVLSNQGAGIPPTVKVVYNDFRDEVAANIRHESDRAGSLLPAGQTREHIAPKFTCTLDEAFAGPIGDEQIVNLAGEFTKGVLLRSRERQTGERPTESFWDSFKSSMEGLKIIQTETEGYVEYINKFVMPVVRATGDAENPYERVNVLDADRLCAQHKLDGTQEIEYQGKPITTMVENKPAAAVPAP